MAGDTTSDLFVPSAHSWTDYISTPGWHRYLFFYRKIYAWLCQERRKEPWRSHTGKAKNTLTSATKIVSTFHAIKEQIRRTSTVCSAIVLYMHWEINVVVIFRFTESGIKDCTECKLPHRRENFGYVTGKYSELAEIVRKQRENKKQVSSDTGKCIFLCLNWPVLFWGGQ